MGASAQWRNEQPRLVQTAKKPRMDRIHSITADHPAADSVLHNDSEAIMRMRSADALPETGT